MNGLIENCGWEFRIQCPQNWDYLAPTNDPNVRACDVCLKNVYRCDSHEEVARHATLSHCVALFGGPADDRAGHITMGEVVEK